MPLSPLLQAAVSGARQPQQPSQPDGSSILRKISGAVLSPLAMAGNVLDVPGSMVRDTVAGIATGDWDKHNPFDQLGSAWWTDAGNRSSGRDVLTATGLTAPNDPQRWELADFGGFATELALDPLTLVSGVGGGIGKALQGTGKASHLFKVGLPFSKTALPVGKAAAGMLDNLAGKAWKTPVPFTGATAGQIGDATNVMRKGLFDYASGGDFTPKGQAFNQARTAIGEELGPEAYKVSAGLRDAMQPVEKQFLDEIASVVSPDKHDETFRRVLTHAAELGGPSGDFRNGFIKAATDITGQAPSPALVDEAEKALGAWKSGFDNLLASEREWGISTGAHQGKNVSYFPRYIDENLLKAREKAGTTGGLFSDSSTVAREEILSDVPQEALRQMLDPANRAQYMPKLSSSGSPHVFSAAKRLERDFGTYLGYTDKAGKVVTPFQHARQLAKYLGELPADATSVHALAPVGLMERRHASSARMIANAKAAHEAFQGAISPSGVKLGKAFRKIGLNDEAAVQKFAALQGITPDAAAKLRVDPETVKAIMRTQKASGSPAWLDFLGKGIDSFNRMFKTNVTMPFPAFHIRNWMSGQHMNITSPHIKGMRDVKDYMAAYNDARKIRNLGEKNTMIREAVAHKAIGGRRVFEDVELSGVSDDLGTSLLNTGQQAYQDARKIVSENPNPLMDAIPGGKAVRTGYNTVIEGGSNFAKTAEYYNRMPMFLYLKRKGLSSAEAAKEVERLQFDYCVDETTEILTKRGWLKYSALHIGDECLSINPETRETVWDSVSAVNVFPSTGTIYHLKSSRFEAMCTGNHRWLLAGAGKRGGHWSLRVQPTTHFKTTHELIESSSNKNMLIGSTGKCVVNNDEPVYTDEFVELVAWYVTEGWATGKRGIWVAQSERHNPSYLQRIRALADHYRGENVCVTERSQDNGWGEIKSFYFGMGIGEKVREVCDGKQITTDFLLDLTPSQLDLFYQTLMDGDGHRSRGYDIWAQKDQGRVDAFQMLCAMRGFRTRTRPYKTNDCSTIGVYRAKHVHFDQLKVEQREYHGIVWCPTTSTGTWMARHNGVTYFTGNSKLSPMEKGFARRIIPFYTFSRKITPQILETLIEQPGGKMAQTIRASNAGRNDEQVMPPHVADTAALPLGRKEDGSESFVTGFGLTPEAALPYITAPLDPKGALLNVGSSLTPLLKMPMEMATGQTFFQRGATGGRPLKDLDPVLGRTLSNIGEQMGLRQEGDGPVNILGDRGASRIAEHLVSNSPASRLLTQVRTATDPRKGFAEKATNILSPVKITDVSPKAQESALIDAASAFADDIGARTWSNRYFPKDMLERAKKTDPQAYQQMMQVNALLSAAKKRAREIGKEQKKPATRDDGERAVRQLLKQAGI